jgi:hypothetical protein
VRVACLVLYVHPSSILFPGRATLLCRLHRKQYLQLLNYSVHDLSCERQIACENLFHAARAYTFVPRVKRRVGCWPPVFSKHVGILFLLLRCGAI